MVNKYLIFTVDTAYLPVFESTYPLDKSNIQMFNDI